MDQHTEHERWLPVVGFEDRYEVSDHGRVRSRRGIRKPSVKPRGYHIFDLYRGNGPEYRSAHRLVLEAFVGMPPEGTQALHWDDDPSNNHLSNLRWGTSSDNQLDAVRNGTHSNTRKTHCPRGHVLLGRNIRPIRARQGHRECLACFRERTAARDECREFSLALANERFDDILSGRDIRTHCQRGHELVATNLRKRGVDSKSCLACHLAGQRAYHSGRSFSLEESDVIFRSLVDGTYSKTKTHCPRGHELIEPNLVPSSLKKGARSCLACKREQSSAGNQRRQFDPEKAAIRYREILNGG